MQAVPMTICEYCGETKVLGLHMSSLLTGLAAGFAVFIVLILLR